MAEKEKEKLERDLKSAFELVKSWREDAAEVFVRYGLAEKTEDVKITKKVPEEKVRKLARGCGCGCVLSVEFEYEQ